MKYKAILRFGELALCKCNINFYLTIYLYFRVSQLGCCRPSHLPTRKRIPRPLNLFHNSHSPAQCKCKYEEHFFFNTMVQIFYFVHREKINLFFFVCYVRVLFFRTNVQHFSFVLTNLEAQWTFGFCRFAPNGDTALVILSCLPWHDFFYKLLNLAAELVHHKDSGLFC